MNLKAHPKVLQNQLDDWMCAQGMSPLGLYVHLCIKAQNGPLGSSHDGLVPRHNGYPCFKNSCIPWRQATSGNALLIRSHRNRGQISPPKRPAIATICKCRVKKKIAYGDTKLQTQVHCAKPHLYIEIHENGTEIAVCLQRIPARGWVDGATIRGFSCFLVVFLQLHFVCPWAWEA
jgi:hypothetical protein